MSSRRVSDEALLGSIAFVGVAAFFLSKAAVRGDSTAAGAGIPPVSPLLGLLLAGVAAHQLASSR